MLKKCFMMLAALTLAENSFAYRPLGTEDAGVAGKGVAQAEISWDYLKWENDDREQVLMLVPIYGLTEKLEISTEIPYQFHDPDAGDSEEGVGDVNVAVKYLLHENDDKKFAFTAKGVIKLDNGDEDKGLGSGDKDYSLYGVASYSLDKAVFHAMFGYTWVGDNENANLRDITLYGIAADMTLTENLHVLAELNGNRHPDRISEEDDPRNALAGVAYVVSDNLTLDAAYRWGMSDSVPDWSTTVGASITF